MTAVVLPPTIGTADSGGFDQHDHGGVESFDRGDGLHLGRFDNINKSSNGYCLVQHYSTQHGDGLGSHSEYDLFLVCECLRIGFVFELYSARFHDHAGQCAGNPQHVQQCKPCRPDGQFRRQ